LKELATLFGHLLRGIMATVDRVGLKASYLSKHKPKVKAFMDVLTVKAFESEIAGQYGRRLLKYQSKLFTFLEHDGVPWNNNNAEHAVKYFAKYRRLTNGRVTESGLQNYLILLSVYQTCRYKLPIRRTKSPKAELPEGRDLARRSFEPMACSC